MVSSEKEFQTWNIVPEHKRPEGGGGKTSYFPLPKNFKFIFPSIIFVRFKYKM